jgi:hypothetical protein
MKGQGEKTTGPVPNHMLNALITTIPTAKMMMAFAIFRGVDVMVFSLQGGLDLYSRP